MSDKEERQVTERVAIVSVANLLSTLIVELSRKGVFSNDEMFAVLRRARDKSKGLPEYDDVWEMFATMFPALRDDDK